MNNQQTKQNLAAELYATGIMPPPKPSALKVGMKASVHGGSATVTEVRRSGHFLFVKNGAEQYGRYGSTLWWTLILTNVLPGISWYVVNKMCQWQHLDFKAAVLCD